MSLTEAIGGGIGRAMPGEGYTLHSEHEYMSRESLLLLLRMYSAMLVDPGGAHEGALGSPDRCVE